MSSVGTAMFQPKVELIYVPWGGSVDFPGATKGNWTICNISLVSHNMLVPDEDLGDIVVSSSFEFGPDSVRAPLLSLASRRESSSRYTQRFTAPWSDGKAVLAAMTGAFPVRLGCRAGAMVALEHRLQVRRGLDPTTLEPPPTPGVVGKPLIIELAGCLRIDS